MGMFEKIFGNGKKQMTAVNEYFKTLTAYQPTFTSPSGGLYEMDVTRAAIHTFATHCSKLKPSIVGTGHKRLERNLQTRPNPWQNTSQFLYRTATILEVCNNCFIVPLFDKTGTVTGVMPVLPTQASIVTSNGVEYLRFSFASGQRGAVEWDRCGILTKMQYKSDIFGADNNALNPTLNLLSVQNQGICEGIRSSAAIRFMAKIGQSLRPEDLKKEQENFKALNLSADNNGGVLMFDQKYADVKQIDSKPYVVDAEQMQIINNNIFNYFQINEKILRNEWDEQVWNAYYEGKVEPYALQLSLVLTNMLFTEREIAFGAEVLFSANRLQFATTNNKVSLITQLFDRGLISFNEGREILQMPPIEGGDTYMIRGEYVSRDEKISGKTDEPILITEGDVIDG